jgi:Ca2+-binding RTX toxin-like protein
VYKRQARNLITLEKYFGNSYVGSNGANPNALAAPVLENIFKDLSNWMYGYMVSQTILKDIIKSITIIGGLDTVIEKINAAIDTDKNVGFGILGDFVIAIDALKIKDSVNFNQFRQYYVAKGEDYGWAIDSIGKNIIQGTTSNDILAGTSNDDAIYGGTNDDSLTGNAGNDLLCGGEGIDTVNGGDGADTIYGGKGNDKLYGGNGNDTYVFNLGDGQDIIQDLDGSTGNIDVITFGKGILAENVSVERKGENIELSIKGTEDKIIIANYFSDYNGYSGYKGYYIVEKIKFEDGTEWGIADIKSAATIIRGTEGNDTISGGRANDKLYGGKGNDTYIFGKGYGQDIIDNTGSLNTDLDIVLLKDIKSNEVEFETTVKDLSIKVKGTNDKITISGYFNGGEYSLEELRFEDGITLSDKEIISNYSEEGSYSLTNSLNILKQTYCATSTDLAINSTQKSTSLSSNEDINLFVNKN